MKRIISTAVALAFVVAMPLAAADTKGEKEAKEQCRVEYKQAKKDAKKLSSHKQRVDANHAAKERYKDCLARAKKM
jgi:Ni/Co efflux regulator RcnB